MSAMMTMVLAGVLAVSGEETTAVKVTVKGMSCPTGCAPKVQKGLQGLAGAKDVKMTDFEAGLFTVVIDATKPVKPADIKKAAGAGFEVTKIEATLEGTVAKEKDGFVLTTKSGAKYSLLAPAKKEGAAPAECPIGKIDGLVKENKAAVKITGSLDECCAGAVSLVVAKVESCPCDGKATN